MEPVEINAGEYYLRQLRADDRIDDRVPLVDASVVQDLDAAREYVRLRAEQWENDRRYSWAVCDSLSNTMIGEVGLAEPAGARAEATCWTHPAHRGRGIAAEALGAALRFGFHGVGLDRVDFQHAEGNTSAARVAEKCGFTVQSRNGDVVVWSRLATDPLR